MESDIAIHINNQELELVARVNCAAHSGDLHRVKLLTGAGADPNMTDYDGRSPLVRSFLLSFFLFLIEVTNLLDYLFVCIELW